MRWSTFLSVSIRTTPTLEIARPQELFEDTYVNGLFGPPQYDVMADGEHFLVIKRAERERSPLPFYFVEDWFQELSRRAPLGR